MPAPGAAWSRLRAGVATAGGLNRRRLPQSIRMREVALGALVAALLIAAGIAGFAGCAVSMPGRSFGDPPPALTPQDRATSDRLRAHVRVLATEIGERNLDHYEGLERARAYIDQQYRAAGYDVTMRPYKHRGETFYNVEAVLPGRSSDTIVVGAHYDSVEGSPGANDNASGVAALIELARALRGSQPPMTVRFVAFANEEPPYFNTGEGMGSREYARALAASGDAPRAMFSLETVGLYSEAPGSQHYPPLIGALYPDRGNFIGFVGDLQARALVRRTVGAFRDAATLPSEGAALPQSIPGVAWSDHRSFSEIGVPALMVTDTAPFRDPHYHRASDTAERLDYERMARLVSGLVHVVGTAEP
jgi:hypothetical protein